MNYLRNDNFLHTCLQKSLRYAEELKLEGNDHFRQRRWNEALVAYQSGLGHLPKRRPKNISESPEDRLSHLDEDEDEETTDPVEPVVTPNNEMETETGKECAKVRAVLNANIGACFVKMVRSSRFWSRSSSRVRTM